MSDKATRPTKPKKPVGVLTERTGYVKTAMPAGSDFGVMPRVRSNWSYHSYPMCAVYMPDGDVTKLKGQGNVFFEILYDQNRGLGFLDKINSGIMFFIGYPTMLELYGFLDTLGMKLICDVPYPEGFTRLKAEIDEMRAGATFSLWKRRQEYFQSEDRHISYEERRRYLKAMRIRLRYDENNRALNKYSLVLQGKLDITELASVDPPL